MEAEELKQLLDHQEFLIEKVSKKGGKDIWDKLSTFSTLFSSILIAAIGVYFTNVYKQQEVRLAEAQTVEKFLQHLSGPNDNEKRGAIMALAAWNKDLAARLGALYASSGTIDALESILKTTAGETKEKLRDALIDAYFNRGLESLDKNQFLERAISDYSKVLQLESEGELDERHGVYFVANTYHNRGMAYLRIGKYDVAMSDAQKSIQIGPDNPQIGIVYWTLASAYEKQGDDEQAKANYNLAVKYDTDGSTYGGRAYYYYQKKDYDSAIADFSKALSISPDNFWAIRGRGNAYREVGDLAKAAEDLRRALNFAPDAAQKSEMNNELTKIEELTKLKASIAKS
jgi:tetratricopeptide (TPR) repeat protein